MESLTELELDIVSHTLGVDIDKAVNSKKKKDKKLPKEFFRNYYCYGQPPVVKVCKDYTALSGLEERGIVRRWEKFDNLYFGVTEKGVELFKAEFNNQVNQQPTVG